eukprot:3177442-Pyramimonas_sp.AAC.1
MPWEPSPGDIVGQRQVWQHSLWLCTVVVCCLLPLVSGSPRQDERFRKRGTQEARKRKRTL